VTVATGNANIQHYYSVYLLFETTILLTIFLLCFIKTWKVC